MVTRYGQADIPREVCGRRADRRSAPAADFPSRWRRLSSEARGPKAPPFVQYPKGLHLAHKKAEYGYEFDPYLVIKKIA